MINKFFGKRRKGFTLAEVVTVLIVMSAIAGILVPTLTTSSEGRVMLTALKKNYSDLATIQDALNLENMRNPININIDNDVRNLLCNQDDVNRDNDGIIPKYLKTQRGRARQDYIDVDPEGNMIGKLVAYNAGNRVKSLDVNGENPINIAAPNYIILKNNVIWVPYFINRGNFGVYVDVNGIKSPNIVGRDIFYFNFSFDNAESKWVVEPVQLTAANGNCADNCQQKNSNPYVNCVGCADRLLD